MTVRIKSYFVFSDPKYPCKPIRIVDAIKRAPESGIFSGWGLSQLDGNGNPNDHSTPDILRYTNMRTLSYEECFEELGTMLNPTMICAVSTDENQSNDPCVDTDSWQYSGNSYLGGFPLLGEQTFYSLSDAQEAALEQADVGGITSYTLLAETSYTLRSGTEFKYSANGEESWIKPSNPCASCAKGGSLILKPSKD